MFWAFEIRVMLSLRSPLMENLSSIRWHSCTSTPRSFRWSTRYWGSCLVPVHSDDEMWSLWRCAVRRWSPCPVEEFDNQIIQLEENLYENYLNIITLSRAKVFVTAKLHPASKDLRIIALVVAGGAEAKPNGFSNFIPRSSMLRSTSSIGVWNFGNSGSLGTEFPADS